MERMITNLFDFQRFKQNARLGNIIQDVQNRYASTISDDDLEWVSAAGEGSDLSSKLTIPGDSPAGDRP